MSRRHPLLLSAATAGLAGLVVWGLLRAGAGVPPRGGTPVTRARQRAGGAGTGRAGKPARPLTEAEFDRLKQRLVACDAACTETLPNWEISPEYRAAAEEVVDRAPFSPGMMALLDMAARGQLLRGRVAFLEVLEPRLQAPGNGVLRRQMMEAPWDDLTGTAFRNFLIGSAGEGCGPAEYAALRDALPDPRARERLEYGHTLGLARTAPAEALTAALAWSGNGEARGPRNPLLEAVMDRLPPDADFAALGARLPGPADLPGEDLQRDASRPRLAARWAATDPAAAAAWVLTEGTAVAPGAVIRLVNALHPGDSAPALAWLHALPPGPEHDAAIGEIIRSYRALPAGEVEALAATVQNPANRASIFETLRVREVLRHPRKPAPP